MEKKLLKNNDIIVRNATILIDSEIYTISLLSNLSALIKEYYGVNINWVGFYLVEDDSLILGPFQGQVACSIIKKGYGICGLSLLNNRIYNISDVTKETNYISCDYLSKSELVIPIYKNNKIYGLLDLDSPIFSFFDEINAYFLEEIAKKLSSRLGKLEK
ncbi:MAG: GAF domain-containing protein [Acholeplasmatales bacterium]|nr:GAF domain-containing protein [Acholeplasmatales bacterium]